MGAFTTAAYVEEVAIPIVLVVLLADGWACKGGPAFRSVGGLRDLVNASWTALCV